MDELKKKIPKKMCLKIQLIINTRVFAAALLLNLLQSSQFQFVR